MGEGKYLKPARPLQNLKIREWDLKHSRWAISCQNQVHTAVSLCVDNELLAVCEGAATSLQLVLPPLSTLDAVQAQPFYFLTRLSQDETQKSRETSKETTMGHACWSYLRSQNSSSFKLWLQGKAMV